MNRDVTERIRRNIKNVVHMPAIINTNVYNLTSDS